MMTLMNRIKQMQISARKSGFAEASLLTTLLGEAAMVGKNSGRETNDAEVVSVVKKFIKNIDETITALTSRGQDTSLFVAERQVLEQFLPKQLNESQLIDIAKQFNDMPSFMKHLKENFAGQYEGKLAATVAKNTF